MKDQLATSKTIELSDKKERLNTSRKGKTAVSINKLSKAYPGVQALQNIDLDIRHGEIHALLGQNGAGKSTLIRMLSGAEQPDKGTIEMSGGSQIFRTPQESQKAGIFTIFQELSLVPELSVAENIFISDVPKNKLGIIDWRSLKIKAKESMNWLGFSIDVDLPVKRLSVAQKQGVELAKALHHKAEVVLLDEPSAALPQPDVRRLFDILRSLRDQGLSIVYISHRLEEVQELCDIATVLRDGKKVATYQIKDTGSAELVRAMVGRDVKSSLIGEALSGETRPRLGSGKTGKTVMSVKHFNDGNILHNISFELHEGEVLGVTGLLGNGQSELASCLFGDRQLAEGAMSIYSKQINMNNPANVIKAGIGLLPEERKTQGLVLGMSIENNITLASYRDFSRGTILNKKKEKAAVDRMMNSLKVSASDSKQQVGTLSGGNQQKVVLAKWLVSQCRVLIFAEPTRGIDVGAKEEIYNLIKKFADDGGAVLIISSEIPEASMCDRVFVMNRGTFAGELAFDEIGLHSESILNLCCE